MKIRTRMFIGILGAVIFLFVSNMIAQSVFNSTNEVVEKVTKVNNVKIQTLNTFKNLSDQRALLFRNLLLLEDETALKQVRADLKLSSQRIGALLKKLDGFKLQGKEAKLYAKVQGNLKSANASFVEFKIAVDEDFKEEALEILIEEFNPKFIEFSNIVSNFKQFLENENKNAISELEKQQNFGVMILWIVLGVSIVIFSVAGIFVARSFTVPIESMRETMRNIISSGDLNYRVSVTSKDEIGQTGEAINDLLSTIQHAIDDVNMVMDEMAKGEFGRKIEHEYQGHFLTLKNGVNESYDQIFNMVVILRGTASNLRKGVLLTVKNEGFELRGDYASVSADLNLAMERLSGTVNGISTVLEALSKGDFSNRVNSETRGDFVKLESGINQTIEGLESFVSEVSMVQSGMSDGDLTQHVSGKYYGKMAALSDSLNTSIQNIASMIARVEAVTKLVVAETSQIAIGSQTVSTCIKNEVRDLEENAEKMGQLTLSVQQNASNASSANDETKLAQTQLAEGVEIMTNALNSMDRMTAASERINDITTLIDGIAFQTNLLALNAAVEAARAGEHGRGFAVVASEVRSLAGKSSDAASDIKKLIENSVSISNESVAYVRETSSAMKNIQGSIEKMSSVVSDIAVSSNEQASDIASISQAIQELEASGHTNVSSMEESAAATQDLTQQANELLQLVSNFRIDRSLIDRVEHMQSSAEGRQFGKMIEAHLAWKAKIRSFVNDIDVGVSYEVATDHTACILGKWLYAEGVEFMHLDLMKQLEVEHAEMHLGIKHVMDAKEIEDSEAIEAGLQKVDEQSDKVVSLLEDLSENFEG